MGLSCRNFEMSSRGSSCNVKKLCPIRIRTNPPPPEEWTLVKEYNMEKRDDYQVQIIDVVVGFALSCALLST